ncbi:cupin domain-containing protein [Pseudahrensia aquimaris]|uniref:Cupin domain-containing protein n=1 Tax=Pseudahrensia aquimaris TaxID=744461 RepID=A0ABW3FJ04_9HYPH
MTQIPNSNPLARPLGVVLASSPNLHLWPLSRTHMPVQFVRSETGLSSFQTALNRVRKLSLAARPVVTVNAANLSTAREQMEELDFERPPHLIVEPVWRGDMASLAIASLFAARYDRTALMTVIEAHRPPVNEQGFDHLTGQMRDARLARNRMIIGVQPLRGNGFDMPLDLQVGAKKGTNHLFEATGFRVPDHLKTLERNGVIYTTPRIALQALAIADRTIVDACAMALEASPQAHGVIWPQINVWSALPETSLDDALPRTTDHLYLRPMDLGIATPPHEQIIKRDNTRVVEMGNRLFVLQDCEDLEIIASQDAALVRPKKSSRAAQRATEALKSTNMAQLHTHIAQSMPWGRIERVERNLSFEVVRIVIEPQQTMPEHFHNHRTENWTVAQGTGRACIDGIWHDLKPGKAITVPKQALHGLHNTGTKQLIVLEMRHGDFLNTSDHIRTVDLPKAKLKLA